MIRDLFLKTLELDGFAGNKDLVEFMLKFDLYLVVIGLILELVVSAGVRPEHDILADLFPPECHCLRVRVVETVCTEGSEMLLQKVHQRAVTLV